MKRATLAQGLWVGGLTGLVVLATLYSANQAFGAPFVPYDVWNWQARVTPGNALSLTLSWPGTVLARVFNARESAWGKTSEQIGSLLLSLAVLAGIGLLAAWLKGHAERRRVRAGLWGSAVVLILISAVELAVGLERPVLSLTWLAIVLLGWGILLDSILDGRIFSAISESTDEARRQGLIKLASSALGATLAAWGVGRLIASGDEGTGADRPLTGITPVAPDDEPPVVVTAPRVTPAGSEGITSGDIAEIPIGDDGRVVPVPGTREEITPQGEFYRVDISATPLSLDGESWRLAMAGLFEQTPQLTLGDLRAYPARTQAITLSCISNPVGGTAISSAYWTGLRLNDLLEDLGLLPKAQYLYIQSADGFYETVPMEDMMNPRTLLVYGMNDRTLPDRHGFPLRIYIPNRYGMKQPKWIERIEATETDRGGYWTDRGWSKQAIVNTTSVIDVVAVDTEENGYIPVGGVAWAGARGIQKVEVQIDEGEWHQAALRTPAPSPLAWVQWRYHWMASPGNHTLSVRATDGTGELQTPEARDTLPNGATGYHSVDVEV
ncbi:MAG: molybdopterin-dependent oxidoreductase [Anaerolineae bacterium]|nr:molybdopterin-dependent oxidoreductase [Anaerolineae bacterium]